MDDSEIRKLIDERDAMGRENVALGAKLFDAINLAADRTKERDAALALLRRMWPLVELAARDLDDMPGDDGSRERLQRIYANVLRDTKALLGDGGGA